MNTKILDYLERAKGQKFDSTDTEQINKWEKEAKKYLLINSLKDNKGIKIILDSFQNEIQQMNDLLLQADSNLLSSHERDRLLDKKAMYKRFISFFDEAVNGLTALDKTMAEEGFDQFVEGEE